MSSLLILGAGGHGKVVADAAEGDVQWSAVHFLDDRYPNLTEVYEWKVIGTLEMAHSAHSDYTHSVVAIGDSERRLLWLGRLRDLGFMLPVISHADATVSRRAEAGPGSVILAQAVVAAGAVLGEGSIVNHGATVDHDCQLGPGVHVCPGGHLGGGVVVGRASWIGIGASVREGIRIGSNVIVGAGAVVIADQPDRMVIAGVPAKRLARTPSE